MAAECDDLGHGSSFVIQIGQSGGAKVVKSQWAFYTRPFADLQEGFSKGVVIGIRLARLFVDNYLDMGAVGAIEHLLRFLTHRYP